MVGAVSDTSGMIRAMRPEIMPGRWEFRTVTETDLAKLLPDVRAMFRETESVSVVVEASDTAAAMSQITLQAHTSLDGVGLTAAVSAVLAEAGIACNMIAAACHDHVFVPEGRAEEACALLRRRAEAETGAA